MPTFGGFGGFPLKFGGGSKRVETLYNALNEARGTAYDTSDDSNVTAETYAHAVALESVWSTHRRMTLMWDPYRMTDAVPRWETIFDIHPPIGASANARRRILQAKFRSLSGQSTLLDMVTSILGDSFVGIVYTPISEAYQRWPFNGYDDDWISNTSHILIRVQFAANQTQSAFWKLMSQMATELDKMLPAWVTWDWATMSEDGTEGFYLDEPLGDGPPPTNLNFETFDV